MAEDVHSDDTYTQGYSESTISTHQSRTVESDAAFVVPHIKPADSILDVGCGPGTITVGLTKYAHQGLVTGIDVSEEILQKAVAYATEMHIPADGPGSVSFEKGNVLDGLSYPDATFDIVFCSQLFPHLQPPELPLIALKEMHRVLKPGGILATRDAADLHFYPRSSGLDELWTRNLCRGFRGGAPGAGLADLPGATMPALFRQASFDADGGKVRVGAGTTVYSGLQARRWFAAGAKGRLCKGDAFRQSWERVGIREDEIEATSAALDKWAETPDAWYCALQCEMLAWK